MTEPAHAPGQTEFSRTLGPPDRWVDSLSTLRHPDLMEEVRGPEEVVLSYAPRQAESWPVDLAVVRLDLQRGMWLRPGRPHPKGDRYYLAGAQYEVELLSRLGEQNHRPLAAVMRISAIPDGSLPRRAGYLLRPVDFERIWLETECDLGALQAELDRPKRLRQARAAATEELTASRRDGQLARRAELHGAARRKYQALRALLRLLAERAEESAVSADGVVEVPHANGESPSPYLYVRVDGDGAAFDDANVVVRGDSGTLRCRVRETSGGLLALEARAGGRWDAGQDVTIRTVPRFSMRQNDIALERFLQSNVEGDWTDLAALLCQPQTLRNPPKALPPRFFCDEDPDEHPLNAGQRLAVAGALATPHGFVVQGPPGTGKTTVICELVRQLAARGERVLLLAPAHVAVDEVLRRAGRKPGIRALRLAWDESLVDEDLRRYMPDRAGGEFVSALRRPGTSNADRWAARLRSLRAEIAAVDRLASARQARDEAAARAMAAESAQRTAQQGLGELSRREGRESAALRQDLAAAQELQRSARERATQARDGEDAAWRSFTSYRPPIDDVCSAVRFLAASTSNLAVAADDERDAERRWMAWRSSWNARRRRLEGGLSALAGPHQAAAQAAAAAWSVLQAAEAAMRETRARRGRWGRFADIVGLGIGYRLRTDWDQARQAWISRDGEWRLREEERSRLQAELGQLDGEAAATGEPLTRDAATARARREVAETTRRHASEQWRTVTQAATGSVLPEPRQHDAVLVRLEAVLSHPAEADPLPASLIGSAAWEAHDQLRRARKDRLVAEAELAAADQQQNTAEEAVRVLRSTIAAEHAALVEKLSNASSDRRAAEATMGRATADLTAAMTSLGYQNLPPDDEVTERRTVLARQVRVLPHYAELEQRWFELMASRSEAEVIAEVGDALVRSVNLVCATTTGIAGPSARVVGNTDFDTLIVDEASRVIDSEFLIGAVRARRWVLVGDEHQLPPHVDQADEYHLHALAALHRHERGSAATLEESVAHLAALWREDDEQRVFRANSVLEVAARLHDSGLWQGRYQAIFTEAHSHFRGNDPDRDFLATLRDHLIRSLLERTVERSPDGMRQRLEVQRRMIAPIAEIVRTPIYAGAYSSPSDEELARAGVRPLTTPTFDRPVVFLDTSLQPKVAERQVGHGFVNDLECDWVERACLRYETELRNRTDLDRPVTVNILCFYQAQALELRRRLGAPLYPRFRRLSFDKIAPIDRLQGQESDLVFVTFSRVNPTPGQHFGRWLQDLRRLNVACTRAHRALVLVGHRQMLSRLRATPAAADFYRHLNKLFDESDDYLLMTDFLR